MTNYNWQIMSMQVKPVEDDKQNVVITVNYVCTGRDDEAGVNSYGAITVTLDPEGEFTPFEQLTEEQVMGWVFDAINKEEVEASVAAQIEAIKHPAIVTPPLPWIKPEVAPVEE